MNRLLIPAAVATLVIGCARPAVTASEPYSADSYYAPPETTVIVREVHYQDPVVYVDSVYMAEEAAPLQPVYVTEEYNEYNEYNHTDVYVRQSVPRPTHSRKPGWSPRGRQQPPPRDRRRDDGSTGDRNRPPEPERPKIVNPKPPVKKTLAPVTNERQKAPVPPTPAPKPTPPKQAPAQNGSVPATQVLNGAPKQAPTPPVDKPAATESEAANVQVGMTKAGRK
jgi:hypothetical protein